MKKLIVVLSIVVLVACASPAQEILNEQEIGEAIAGTLTAMPAQPTDAQDKMQLTMAAGQTQNAIWQATKDARPTNTPRPTAEPTEKLTLTPTESVEELRAGVIQLVVDGLLSMYDVEEVNLARLDDGVLEIEVRTTYISQAHQPDVSYLIIQFLSEIFGGRDIGTLHNFTGTDNFAIRLVTYSDSGDYPYESYTEFTTLQSVSDRAISYEEWVAAAYAGFR